MTNQIHKPEEYTLFNKIHNMPDSDFTAVYGVSHVFISVALDLTNERRTVLFLDGKKVANLMLLSL